MNANKCQSTPLWALIKSMSEHKCWKTRRQRTIFLGQNIHVLPKVLYPEHKRDWEWGLGQCYNSRTEKCLNCSAVVHWEICQGGERKPFLFFKIVRRIDQSQLSMVCLSHRCQLGWWDMFKQTDIEIKAKLKETQPWGKNGGNFHELHTLPFPMQR